MADSFDDRASLADDGFAMGRCSGLAAKRRCCEGLGGPLWRRPLCSLFWSRTAVVYDNAPLSCFTVWASLLLLRHTSRRHHGRGARGELETPGRGRHLQAQGALRNWSAGGPTAHPRQNTTERASLPVKHDGVWTRSAVVRRWLGCLAYPSAPRGFVSEQRVLVIHHRHMDESGKAWSEVGLTCGQRLLAARVRQQLDAGSNLAPPGRHRPGRTRLRAEFGQSWPWVGTFWAAIDRLSADLGQSRPNMAP